MNTKALKSGFARRMAACAALGASFLFFTALTPGTATASEPAVALEGPSGTTARPPAPPASPSLPAPPAPKDKGGVAMAGGWYGPYQLQVLHSGKCLDMGNSTAEWAGATQFTCQPGRNTQKWWVWVVTGDGSVSYQHLYNAHSGKCLSTWSGWQNGAQLGQATCAWGSDQIWIKSGGTTSGFWTYRSEFSQKCMDVLGFNKNNAAPVVQWDCAGGNNQVWANRQY